MAPRRGRPESARRASGASAACTLIDAARGGRLARGALDGGAMAAVALPRERLRAASPASAAIPAEIAAADRRRFARRGVARAARRAAGSRRSTSIVHVVRRSRGRTPLSLATMPAPAALARSPRRGAAPRSVTRRVRQVPRPARANGCRRRSRLAFDNPRRPSRSVAARLDVTSQAATPPDRAPAPPPRGAADARVRASPRGRDEKPHRAAPGARRPRPARRAAAREVLANRVARRRPSASRAVFASHPVAPRAAATRRARPARRAASVHRSDRRVVRRR